MNRIEDPGLFVESNLVFNKLALAQGTPGKDLILISFGIVRENRSYHWFILRMVYYSFLAYENQK